MDPKFFLAIMLLHVPIMLLHAPVVSGCVVFLSIGPDPTKMDLYDNNSHQCTYTGGPNQADGVSYGMSCASGVSAIFNPNLNNNQGGVAYSPPWGSFNFATDYTPDVYMYQAQMYDGCPS